jgi:hypothetical protein
MRKESGRGGRGGGAVVTGLSLRSILTIAAYLKTRHMDCAVISPMRDRLRTTWLSLHLSSMFEQN